jgi:DNA-binding NarL/FixJ family response regulator
LVFMPGSFDHVQLAWRYPALRGWLEGLSSRFRVVQFDPRGSGMSTRNLDNGPRAEDYLRDLEAVADKLRLQDFILFSCGFTFHTAVRYALKHSDRACAIVVAGANREVTRVRAPAQWLALPEQDWDLFLYSVVPRDRTPQQAKEIVELLKQAYDQPNFVLRMRAHSAEPLDSLRQLKVPVLVLHARDYPLFDASEAMAVAQSCDGRMVLIDGNTPQGDPEQGIRAIESFLNDISPDAREVVGAHDLSAREVDVLRLLAAGKSNAQIADALVISQNTVIRHVSNIFAKIGVENRTEAAAYAHRANLT